jgi:hypothetical protein
MHIRDGVKSVLSIAKYETIAIVIISAKGLVVIFVQAIRIFINVAIDKVGGYSAHFLIVKPHRRNLEPLSDIHGTCNHRGFSWPPYASTCRVDDPVPLSKR